MNKLELELIEGGKTKRSHQNKYKTDLLLSSLPQSRQPPHSRSISSFSTWKRSGSCRDGSSLRTGRRWPRSRGERGWPPRRLSARAGNASWSHRRLGRRQGFPDVADGLRGTANAAGNLAVGEGFGVVGRLQPGAGRGWRGASRRRCGARGLPPEKPLRPCVQFWTAPARAPSARAPPVPGPPPAAGCGALVEVDPQARESGASSGFGPAASASRTHRSRAATSVRLCGAGYRGALQDRAPGFQPEGRFGLALEPRPGPPTAGASRKAPPACRPPSTAAARHRRSRAAPPGACRPRGRPVQPSGSVGCRGCP